MGSRISPPTRWLPKTPWVFCDVFLKPTLWFWGFWISLAPHWAGKYLIPGSRAPPIAQGRKAVKFLLFSIRRIRIIYNFLVGFLLCFSNRSDNIRTHKKSNWKSSSKNRGKHSRKYLKPPPLIGTYIHTHTSILRLIFLWFQAGCNINGGFHHPFDDFGALWMSIHVFGKNCTTTVQNVWNNI